MYSSTFPLLCPLVCSYFQARTTIVQPFRSPLLAQLLRGYFIEGKPRQDQLLVSHLKREKRIPLPLIAMVTTLVSHVSPRSSVALSFAIDRSLTSGVQFG
jgi:hypothetical protein